uniref:Secreted protein n=1 Tax=Anopheles darlingi TaxID=43151 RepID=A0A2M4D7C8_ANODA
MILDFLIFSQLKLLFFYSPGWSFSLFPTQKHAPFWVHFSAAPLFRSHAPLIDLSWLIRCSAAMTPMLMLMLIMMITRCTKGVSKANRGYRA